jgi:SAM-dependent methyltransferase
LYLGDKGSYYTFFYRCNWFYENSNRDNFLPILCELADSKAFKLQYRQALSTRPDTMAFVERAIKVSGLAEWHHVWVAMVTGESGRLLSRLARIVSNGAQFPHFLMTCIPTGPDAGHPVWHVINPFYMTWVTADLRERENVQKRWAENVPNSTQPDSDSDEAYTTWLRGNVPSRAEFRDFIHRFAGKHPTVLDIGCSDGNWLRYFAEQTGARIEELRGIDIHEYRVAAARNTLAKSFNDDLATLPVRSKNLARNLRKLDLLDPTVPQVFKDFGEIDIVFLFVITGCFTDEQRDIVLPRIASIGARYIFQTNVTRKWALWHGRDDDPERFAALGYREISRTPTPELLGPENARFLVLPRKYWTNPTVHIYERSPTPPHG